MKVNLFWQLLKVAPAALGASLVVGGSALAAPSSEAQVSDLGTELDTELSVEEVSPSLELANNELDSSEAEVLDQIGDYSDEGNDDSLGQVNSVFQLRDVSPGEWYFEALRNLVERYGCIAGYPDGTYRPNRALSRAEFAAGLNACLTSLERLIQEGRVSAEDLATLQRLIQEFEAELATLGTRVDNLEGRVAFLEDNQFSTTTKLAGEVVFGISDVFGDVAPGPFDDETDESSDVDTVFGYRVRLNLNTSFTGEDRLRTRLEARDFEGTDEDFTGTRQTRLNLEGSEDGFILDQLWYRFPVGDALTFHVAANAVDADDIFDAVNPLSSSGGGSLSRFLDRNPLTLRSENGDAGFGVNFDLNESITLSALYLSGEGNTPTDGNGGAGLFNGNFSTGAQLLFSATDNLDLALTYIYSYTGVDDTSLAGGLGGLADDPFGGAATTAHRIGTSGAFRFGQRIVLGGFFGYAFANAETDSPGGSEIDADEDDDAELLTASLNLSFLDLGKEGAALVIGGGILPRVESTDAQFQGDDAEDDELAWLVEAQYKFPINDNIEITPGAYVLFNANGNNDADDIYVGIIRTRFSF